MLSKSALIQKATETLEVELQAILAAAKAAHEAATHEESKPEDQYDTRGLEASYLAGAQAHRAAELQGIIAAFRQLPGRDAPAGSVIAPGSLVELSWNGRSMYYFIAREGGGLSVAIDGKKVQIITPKAPLGEALLGRREGDVVEVESQDMVREYEVISVR